MTISRTTGAALLSLGMIFGSVARADLAAVIPTAEQAAEVNDHTVGVIFTRDGPFLDLVDELGSELELAAGLRLVPMLGKNHVQSVYDLLYLKGVDFAFARADAIEYVERIGGVSSVRRLTHNVARISDEKIVIVAGRDHASVLDLDGERVGMGLSGSGEFVTGTLLFGMLGIGPMPVEADGLSALEQVRSGELAAMVYLLGAPGEFPDGVAAQQRAAVAKLGDVDDLHVLELPPGDELSKLYRPATLDHEDLPGLMAEGEELLTSSVDVNLLAYVWKAPNQRTQKMERFVKALVERIEVLQEDAYQPGWKAVSLTEETPNIFNSPMVARAIKEREAAKMQFLAAEARAEAQAKAEAARVAELKRRRDKMIARLNEELGDADITKMERTLDRLDALLSQADEDSAGSPEGN